jgi:hypothetical protein
MYNGNVSVKLKGQFHAVNLYVFYGQVGQFRSARRIPAVVWRNTSNGAVLARCSQPEVSSYTGTGMSLAFFYSVLTQRESPPLRKVES